MAAAGEAGTVSGGLPDASAARARLAELGYESKFNREMSLWQNFSLGFTYLSPVVGVYSTFAIAFVAGGAPMMWSIVIAGVGQLLVSLVFAEVVAQFPIAGGVYPWTRRLVGRRYGWITGWIYAWALVATVASVTTGAAPFIGSLFGFTPTRLETVLLAGLLMVIALGINLSGTKWLGRVAMAGFIAELVGALFVGIYLLAFQRHQSLAVFVHTQGTAHGHSYAGPFLAAALLGLYLFYGFEACGDVAEEVPHPGRQIPRAMRRTIYIGGFAALLITVALVLSQRSFAGILSGADANPIGATLQAVFGSVGSKVITVIVLMSFLSCTLSLQAAASRLLYSYGRDHMVFGSRLLSRFHEKRHVPPYAMIVATAVPLAIVAIAEAISTNALTIVISFASAGIYVAFQLVVFAALYARWRGWKPNGEYKLGRWGWPVGIAAQVYGIAAAVDLAWPRSAGTWYQTWSVILGLAILIGIGVVYMLAARPYGHSTAPAGDASATGVPAAAAAAQAGGSGAGNAS